MVRRLPIALVLVAVLSLIPGCSEEQLPPMRLGINDWPGYAPFNLAYHQGFFDFGDIQVIGLANTNELVRGIAMGSIDGGGLTLPELLEARDLGLDLVIILVTNVSEGADSVIAKPEFGSMAELRGKKIGVTKNALGSLVLTRAAESADLTPADYQRIDSEFHLHEQLLVTGSVDAVVTFEPVRTRLLEFGAREVFSSKSMPGEIVDVIAVTRETWIRRREDVNAVANAWFRALAFIESNPEEAMPILNRRFGFVDITAATAMNGLYVPDRQAVATMLENSGAALRPALAEIESLMLKAGTLKTQRRLIDLFPAEPTQLKIE